MKQFNGILIFFLLLFFQSCQKPIPRHRIIVPTDIGGGDLHDCQFLAHLFLYADTLEIIGLVSSPTHEGRKGHIFEIIAVYEKDLPKLNQFSNQYPSPEYLREISFQGVTGPQKSVLPKTLLSDETQLIIDEAREDDMDSLNIPICGSMSELAQALYKSSEIKSKVRAGSISSTHTVQDSLAGDYVYNEHPDLWRNETDSTFKGTYPITYQKRDYNNGKFIGSSVKTYRAMEDLCYRKKVDNEMVDMSSIFSLTDGEPSNPAFESWDEKLRGSIHVPNYWTDLIGFSLI
ncbi:MAG: hypothetical protein ACI9DJ_002433 [Algoriphagus sp.]|jgi:hypothetical protein